MGNAQAPSSVVTAAERNETRSLDPQWSVTANPVRHIAPQLMLDVAWAGFYNSAVAHYRRRGILREALEAFAAYAFHFDAYVNSACRQQPYSEVALQYHFYELPLNVRNHYRNSVRQVTDKRTQSACAAVQHPLATAVANGDLDLGIVLRMRRDPLTLISEQNRKRFGDAFERYVAVLRPKVRGVYNGLMRTIIPSPYDTVVYRGLRLPLDGTVRLDMTGFSSCALDVEEALQIAAAVKAPPYLLDLRRSRIVILVITVPKGTNIIPIGLCTIQDEAEVVVAHEGTLERQRPDNHTHLRYWNDFIGTDGRRVVARPDDRRPVPVTQMHLQMVPSRTPVFPDAGFRLKRTAAAARRLTGET